MAKKIKEENLSEPASKRAELEGDLKEMVSEGSRNLSFAFNMVGVSADFWNLDLAIGAALLVKRSLGNGKARERMLVEGVAEREKRTHRSRGEGGMDLLVRISPEAVRVIEGDLVRFGLSRSQTMATCVEYRGTASCEAVRALVAPSGGVVIELCQPTRRSHHTEVQREAHTEQATALGMEEGETARSLAQPVTLSGVSEPEALERSADPDNVSLEDRPPSHNVLVIDGGSEEVNAVFESEPGVGLEAVETAERRNGLKSRHQGVGVPNGAGMQPRRIPPHPPSKVEISELHQVSAEDPMGAKLS